MAFDRSDGGNFSMMSPDNVEGRYLTYGLLTQINESSVMAGRNQNLPEGIPSIVDSSERYPVLQAFVHNDVEIRTIIVMTRYGDCSVIEMSFEEYESLPVRRATENRT